MENKIAELKSMIEDN